jgi:single-strand DNA-binding protein
MDYCRITMLGRLTQDPEVRYTPSGTAVASFSVAVNRKYRKAESEELVEAVTFVSVRSFGKPAEHAGQYLNKGRQVLVDGELRQDEWADKESGEKRQRLYVVAQRIIYLGKGNGNGQTPAPEGGDAGEADIPF